MSKTEEAVLVVVTDCVRRGKSWRFIGVVLRDLFGNDWTARRGYNLWRQALLMTPKETHG